MRLVDTLPISYRQLDHWISRGWINPDGAANPGSGNARADFTGTERTVLEHMAALVADGVTPARAAVAARELATTGRTVLAGHTITARPPEGD